MRLRKLLAFLAGLVMGSFPPEAIVILMEPPPGTGRLPRGVAATRERIGRMRSRRAIRHQHPMRRKLPPVRRDPRPPIPPG